MNDVCEAVKDPLEAVPVSYGPKDGMRLEAELCLDLVHDLVGGKGRPVHLVDEGEERETTHPAHLEELARLRLEALGAVEEHDGVVGSRQRAVRVLGEVLVARGVQDVDPQVVVVEVHDGGADG